MSGEKLPLSQCAAFADLFGNRPETPEISGWMAGDAVLRGEVSYKIRC
jgi:hypothetical protein